MTTAADRSILSLVKTAMPFLEQDRPEKVKEIYRALKRDHPDMPAEEKARIAARQGKPGKQKQGPPYKGPIKNKEKKATLEKTARLYPRIRRCDGETDFADEFKGTPFYKEALALQKEDAERESVRARRWAEQEKEMAEDAQFRVKQADLEAKLAEWRYKNMGIGTPDAVKAAMQKIAYMEVPPEGRQLVHGAMMHMLSILLAQYILYYQCHWKSEGTGYYGDHELFSKLYGKVQGEVDSIAEKIIGYHGTNALDINAVMQTVTELLGSWTQEPSLFAQGLSAERMLQDMFKQIYEQLKQNDIMPLGLDDWIMGVANDHETHTYLLQQRLSQPMQVGQVPAAKAAGPAMPKTAATMEGFYRELDSIKTAMIPLSIPAGAITGGISGGEDRRMLGAGIGALGGVGGAMAAGVPIGILEVLAKMKGGKGLPPEVLKSLLYAGEVGGGIGGGYLAGRAVRKKKKKK